jgi:signal transduction histidine kinase
MQNAAAREPHVLSPGAEEVLRDPARLRALQATGLLDSAPEEAFDRLTRLAGGFLNAPLALVNLLSNAVKFSPAGAEARVWVEKRGDEALFQVRDRGRGIPSDQLEAIFERVRPVDSSDARKKGGTGLGLSISRSIVQQHGGRIWVASAVGQGSTFFFTLPLARPPRGV